MQLYNNAWLWFRISKKVVIDQRKVQKSGKKLESDTSHTEEHKRKCAETLTVVAVCRHLWVGTRDLSSELVYFFLNFL